MISMSFNNENMIEVLKKGGVVVMPTDTLYGIVGIASDPKTVERIYVARKRAPEKPCIILLGNIDDLKKFSIYPTEEQKKCIDCFSIPTSFILDCENDDLKYLHRGTNTLAFRIPQNEELRNLLLKTGPLIAPSANTEGLPPSENIKEAQKYFGDSVGLYVDGGEIKGRASKVIKLHKNGSISIIRA